MDTEINVKGIDDFSFSCKHTEDNEFANDDSGEEDADSGQGVESVDDDDDSGQGGVESDEDDDDSADEEESLEEEDSPEDQQSTEDEDSGVKQEIEDEESVFDNLKDVDFKTINNDQVRVLVFADIDAAYAFYNEYAKMNGFSIRKNKRGKNKKKQVTWQQFVCSCEGFRQAKYMNLPNRQREQRVITRFGCGAEMRVALDARSGRWHVSRFSDVHNHQLLGDKYVGLLRSHRRLSVADIAQFDSMRKSGISVPQIYGSFASQSGGYHMVAFRKKEMYNWIEKERRMQQGDVKEALKFLQGLLAKDPTLFWSHKVGEDGRLLHLFWCDGGCQIDYEIFGDVLAFDATYGRNKYKCPVVVFSGVNHHKQTCVFGCGIVSDEKEDTYAWLLEQFLQAMKGKAPQCVITDGDMSMRNAIAKVLPDAHHRLCGWHLIRNVTTNVGDLRFTQHFKKCMLGNIEVHDFENRWFAALEEYGLMDNVWVRQLYNKKLMWATAHIKGKFFAGMRTTSRCESLHAHMGKYVQSRNTLADFVYHFQRYLEYIRTNEIEADFKSEYGVQLMQTDLVSLERFASDVYTRELFSIFRKRLLRSLTMNVMESIDTTSSKIFIVGMYGRPALKWQVSTYPLEEDIRCSCLGMESDGLPCVHIIRVLVFLDFDHIPECLVVDRWTKAVKAGVDNRYYYGGMSSESAVQNGRYTALLDSCRRLCFNASKNAEDFNDIRDKIAFETEELVKKNNTIIAGDGQSSVAADEDFVREPVASGSQPRAEGRPGSGQSIKKKVRCSCCKVVGHTRKTCPHARRIGRLVNSDNGASSS